MSDPVDTEHQDYFIRREAQERSAAENSTDPSARRAHEMLADGYAAQLRVMRPAV